MTLISGMTLIKFSHPLTDAQRRQLEALIGRALDDVREIKCQFDITQPFVPQVVALIEALGYSPEQWQREPWIVVLPSLAAGVLLAELHGRMGHFPAIVLLAELHGRMGHFPAIVRLRAELHGRMGHFPAIVRLRTVSGLLVTEFEVAEVINLKAVLQESRTKRRNPPWA